jgi:hypothetical protein
VWKKLNGNLPEKYTADEQKKIARAFFHFKSRGRAAHKSATKRVYIHSAGTTNKFSNGLEIMKLLLVDSLLGNPGFKEAKIVGPAAPTSRRDTIVAYFSDPPGSPTSTGSDQGDATVTLPNRRTARGAAARLHPPWCWRR